MARRVLEIKGLKSLRALNVFHTLVLGVKMLPSYLSEGYEEFCTRIQSLPEADQRKILTEAAIFVKLDPDEVEAILGFVTDQNGVSYQPANFGNLKPDEIVECIVEVALQIAKIKIDLVSADEKKN